MTEIMPPRTGFLDLPAELRLKIYDLVCHYDINRTVLEDIEHCFDGKGTKASLVPNVERSLKTSIPWITLASTCKSISEELKFLKTSPSFQNDGMNWTYVMDLDVYNDHHQQATRQAVWCRLPCSPDQVQTLTINVSAREGSSPWTDGGPASMARAIYQILNHVCHNGPLLIREHPLHDHMRIQDLIINVDIGASTKPPRPGCNVDPRWNYALLLSGFEQIAKMGYLFGYVANIHVRGNGEYAEQAYMVDACGVQSVPRPWQNYGFAWGV